MPPESPRRKRFSRLELLAYAIGLLLLGAYFVLRIQGSHRARREIERFEELRRARPATPAAPAPPAGIPAAPPPADTPPPEAAPTPRELAWASPDQSLWSSQRVKAFGQDFAGTAPPLAVLRIAKIGLEAPVLVGTDDETLDHGLGWIEGTARPGSPGNVGISGHRDSFFRGLKDVGLGDAIELETLNGSESYVVSQTWLVDPKDVWVLDGAASPELTLVTCYPFYYVGSAPKRYVVRASRDPAATSSSSPSPSPSAANRSMRAAVTPPA